MACLIRYKEQILLSIKREILLINIPEHRDTRLWITLPAPPPPPKANNGTTAANDEDDAEPVVALADADEVSPEPTNSLPTENSSEPDVDQGKTEIILLDGQADSNPILHMAISHDNSLLAVTTAGEKALYIYHLNADAEPKLVSRRDLARTSNAIRFSNCGVYLIVADKTGDCYTYACDKEQSTESAKWILAHFSQLLDIIPSQCSNYIITCDRDEKIRCTQVPETTIIQSYCLGHTEYVAAIALHPIHPSSILISCSGDCTLRLWNFINGKSLAIERLPAAALKMAVRQVGNSSHVAVVYYKHELTFEVFCIRDRGSDAYDFERICGHNLNVKGVTNILFDEKGELIICTINREDKVHLVRCTFEDESYVLQESNELNEAVQRAASTVNASYNAEDIELLFKKKFDCIQEYKDRKKLRIEEKRKFVKV